VLCPVGSTVYCIHGRCGVGSVTVEGRLSFLHVFRTNDFSSLGGLYKQLTVFYHAEIISILYDLSRYIPSPYSVINHYPASVEYMVSS
jgi:hypothetical protein